MRGILLEILARVAAPVEGKAQMYIDRLTRRLRVALPDETTLDIEHTGRRNQPNGYPGLDANSLIAYDQLGTGTPDGTKFLRDDQVWAVPSGGGGGTSDHQSLTHLAWNNSGHTGTANRVAGFNGSGAATYLNGADIADFVLTTRGDMLYRDATASTRLPIGGTGHLLTSSGTDPQWSSQSDVRALLDLEIGVDVQAYDADLTALGALGDGLPYRSSGSWGTANPAGMLSVVSGSWKVVGLRTGSTDLSVGTISDGQVVKRSGSSLIGVTLAGSTVTDLLLLGYGDGHTGAVTFDGTTAVSGFSLASRVYTRNDTTDSLEYTTMTLDTSGGDITIVPKGPAIKAQVVTGVGSGTVTFDASGSAASGTTGGAGAAVIANADCYGGTTGGNGRTTGGTSNTGSTQSNGVNLGATGGTGGGNASQSRGGVGGTSTRFWTGYLGSLLDISQQWAARIVGNPFSVYPLSGGTGGGGGAWNSLGGGSSGAGGGGAGVMRVGFGAVSLGSVSLVFKCDGAAGSAGVGGASQSAMGGGGGGAGGFFYGTFLSISGSVYIYCRGGPGGAGAVAAGASGAAGGDGGQGGRAVAIYAGTAPTISVSGGAKGADTGTPITPAVDGSAGRSVAVAL